MLRTAAALASFALCSCGKVDVTTSNLAGPIKLSSVPDVLIGGIKAVFDKKLTVGDEDVKLSMAYEASDFFNLHAPDNVKEVSASGEYALDVATPRWTTHGDGHPFKLGYKLAHKFKNGVTTLKLATSTYGACLKAKADSSGAVALESVSYGYAAKAAGTELSVDNEFELHGRWGADSVYRCTLGGWGVTTTVEQPFEPVMPDLEVATNHQVAKGRSIASSVTVGPESGGGVYSNAKLSYSDKKLQPGATYVVSASQPLTKLKGTKLTMKRSWSF